MKYCFDLDGTLCKNTFGKYEEAEPFVDRIEFVNRLFDSGNEIYIESARGSTTLKDWNEFTNQQLKSWGLKFHKLRTGTKFEADFYIDDKGHNDKDFFKINGENK